MSAPTLHVDARRTGPTAFRGLRLRLKPAHPVLRVCAGRVVAPQRSTAHRTSATARGAVAAGGVRRPGNLRREQLGASIIAYGV